MPSLWPFSSNISSQRNSTTYDPTHEDDGDQDNSPIPTNRLTFGVHSTSVYGYPSTGGVLVLPYCNGVDLTFLHISRFDSAQERSKEAADEDQHCTRMRKLGAWWFTSKDVYEAMQVFDPEKLARKKLVVAAWPRNETGAGVWVVTMENADEAAQRGLGRLWNALSMDERCDVVKGLGGRFYPDPAQCPDLDYSMEECDD